MDYKKNICLIFLLILKSFIVFAQESSIYHGSPFIRNYPPKEYKGQSQIWVIDQDLSGCMYFGNNTGLLQYDGAGWRNYQVANNSVVLSMKIDNKGTIYVGAVNEFGYFRPDSLGVLTYNSLSQFLPDSAKNFNDIWKTLITTDGVYFFARTKIFRWHNNKIDYLSVELSPYFGSNCNDIVYIKPKNKGLAYLDDFKITELPNTDSIKSGGQYFFVHEYDEDKILITTRKKGSYIYDLNSHKLTKHAAGSFTSDFISTNNLFTTIFLDKNKIAYGTLNAGVLIADVNGNPIQILNKKNGLLSDGVYSLFLDKDKNLWIGTQFGIIRIDLSYPVVKYDERHGIHDYVLDALMHKGVQYISTMNQLFFVPKYKPLLQNSVHKLEEVKGINYCWDLFNYKDKLLAVWSRGVALIDKNKSVHLLDVERAYCGLYSENRPGKITIGLRPGLKIADVEENNGEVLITNLKEIPEVTEVVTKLEYDNDGNLWLSTSSQGLVFIRFLNDDLSNYEVTKFKGTNGLPLDLKNMSVEKIDEKICVFTNKGIYNPIRSKGQPDSLISFIHDKYWGPHFTNDSNIAAKAKKVIDDKYIVYSDKIGVFQKNNDGSTFTTAPFSRIKNIFKFSVENNRFVVFGTPDASCIYDLDVTKNYQAPYFSLIRRVLTTNDSLLFNGSYSINKDTFEMVVTQPKSFVPTLDYEHNVLKFEFSAPFYEEADKNEYQYIIEGFDKNWSNWSTETKAVYTNIPEGEYTFKVKAKNVYEHESTIAKYDFIIFPPWYRTWFAYFGYFIFSCLFIFLVVKLNSKRLVKANIKLERIVAERTAEIMEKNEEIRAQADELELTNHELIEQKEEVMAQKNELEQQNEEILAQRDELENKNRKIAVQNEQIKGSIRYALTIQQATLPIKENMDKSFESFILFLPKDIVSGDFYWFYRNQITKQVFIAAVDCTGHGVPGAFMTMIGYRLLNEITIEHQISRPDEIFTQLDLGVKKALRQEQTANDDGMDACLCMLEPSDKNSELINISFCGAKRPLYYHKKGSANIKALAASRKSIGGNQRLAKETHFETQSLCLASGDLLYLSTDGLIDQPSPERKRFGSKRFIEFLEDHKDLPLENQHQKLNSILQQHQATEEQRDDITVIGVLLK